VHIDAPDPVGLGHFAASAEAATVCNFSLVRSSPQGLGPRNEWTAKRPN
jgi:hypothetical protein